MSSAWLVLFSLLALSLGCECTRRAGGSSLTVLAKIPAGFELAEAVFAKDGRRVLYSATQGGSSFVFLGDSRWGPFDGVRDLRWSGDSMHWAFVASRAGGEFVVVEGTEHPPGQQVGSPSFTRDGRAVFETRLAERWSVTVGERQSAWFESQAPSALVSGDGARVAFLESPGAPGRPALQVCPSDFSSCLRVEEHDEVGPMVTDAAGTRLALRVRDGSQERVVTVDALHPELNRSSAPFERVEAIDLSEGARHLAFIGWREGQAFIVKDGAEVPLPTPEMILGVVASASGAALHTAARGGKVTGHLDGRQLGDEFDAIERPIVTSDGTHTAFAVRRGEQGHLVVDGLVGPAFDRVVGAHFARGDLVVFRARTASERFLVAADLRGQTRQEYPHYSAVWDPVIAANGESVAYGVQSGQDLSWRVDPLPPR